MHLRQRLIKNEIKYKKHESPVHRSSLSTWSTGQPYEPYVGTAHLKVFKHMSKQHHLQKQLFPQKCSVNGSLSNSCSLTCGVRQGTILGPLLFLLYINDLANCLSNCKPRMHADDAHLTYAGSNLENVQFCLYKDLGNVFNWLQASKLTLNITKTEFMLIGALKRIMHLISAPTLHLIYQALVKPHFDHCYIAWGNCEKTLRHKLQKMQNRATRVLTFSNYDADTTELLEVLGWKNLASQQEIHKATMMFRCLHGLAPGYLYAKFTWRDSAYDFRDSEIKLNVPLPPTNYYRKSFGYNGATLWNSLSCDTRNKESLGVFKRTIKDIL